MSNHKNIIVFVWALIVSIAMHASDDEDYVIVPCRVVVSRSNSNDNFMNLIPLNNSDNVVRQVNHDVDSDCEKITGEDFRDAGDRVKEYEDAMYRRNKKTLEQTARLGYLGNLCGVCAMVPGVGPLSLIPTVVGAAAGFRAYCIAHENKRRNTKLQKVINEALKARDCLYAQNIDFQSTSLSSLKDSNFDEEH